MEYDVFISYSRRDKKLVEKICKQFTIAGVTYWMDTDGIETGDEFKTIIVDAIDSCRVFVYFSSIHANASKWTAREITYADRKNMPIIPIRLDNSEYHKSVQFDLGGLDFVDFTTNDNIVKFMPKLIQSIKNKSHDEAINVEAVKAKGIAKVTRKTWWLLLLIVALVIGAIIGYMQFISLAPLKQIESEKMQLVTNQLEQLKDQLFIKEGMTSYDSIANTELIQLYTSYHTIDKIMLTDLTEYEEKGKQIQAFIDSTYAYYKYMSELYQEYSLSFLAAEYAEKQEELKDITTFIEN
jgi:hypothetical protein